MIAVVMFAVAVAMTMAEMVATEATAEVARLCRGLASMFLGENVVFAHPYLPVILTIIGFPYLLMNCIALL